MGAGDADLGAAAGTVLCLHGAFHDLWHLFFAVAQSVVPSPFFLLRSCEKNQQTVDRLKQENEEKSVCGCFVVVSVHDFNKKGHNAHACTQTR